MPHFGVVAGFAETSEAEILEVVDCPQRRQLGTELKNDVGVLSDVPNSVVVMDLETVILRNWGLYNLTSMTSCSQLEELEIEALLISELPDLSSYFKMRSVNLCRCEGLAMRLSSIDGTHKP